MLHTMLCLNGIYNVTKIVAAYSYKILIVSPPFIKNATLRMKMGRHLSRDIEAELRLVSGHRILHFASFLSTLGFHCFVFLSLTKFDWSFIF